MPVYEYTVDPEEKDPEEEKESSLSECAFAIEMTLRIAEESGFELENNPHELWTREKGKKKWNKHQVEITLSGKLL